MRRSDVRALLYLSITISTTVYHYLATHFTHKLYSFKHYTKLAHNTFAQLTNMLDHSPRQISPATRVWYCMYTAVVVDARVGFSPNPSGHPWGCHGSVRFSLRMTVLCSFCALLYRGTYYTVPMKPTCSLVYTHLPC